MGRTSNYSQHVCVCGYTLINSVPSRRGEEEDMGDVVIKAFLSDFVCLGIKSTDNRGNIFFIT